MGRARLGLAAAAAAIAVGSLAGAGAGGARPTVAKVVSPDTLIVRLGSGRRVTVRLVGVIAPTRGSCHFGEAVAAVRRLALGKQVTLSADPGLPARDGGGRLLRYVALPDGWDLGQRLVGGGHVLVQPETRPFARREIYVPYAQTAALANEGMWRRCAELPEPTTSDRADVALTLTVSLPDAQFGAELVALATNYGPKSAAGVAVDFRFPAGASIRHVPEACSSAERCGFGLLRPGEARS
jgi:endonuclease YncB( thermonuclease family)